VKHHFSTELLFVVVLARLRVLFPLKVRRGKNNGKGKLLAQVKCFSGVGSARIKWCTFVFLFFLSLLILAVFFFASLYWFRYLLELHVFFFFSSSCYLLSRLIMIGSATTRGNLFIYPHAEEVELCDGARMASILSTTGRRNQAFEDEEGDAISEEKQQPSTVPSPLRSGGDLPAVATAAAATGAVQQHSSGTAGHTVAHHSSNDSTKGATTTVPTRRVPYQCYDMYGFRVTPEEKAAEDYFRRHNEPSESDLKSWSYVVLNWNTADRVQLKELCRRGIPQPRRGVVWQRLLQSWGVKERFPGLYGRLRSQDMMSKNLAEVIERDLDRTFPTHRLFAGGVTAPGQQMLRNMLRAYANYNTKVGYCQGMGFLAATLLLQIEEEEDAFWAFVGLMEGKKYRMNAIFSPGFPELQTAFYVFEGLMRKRMPTLYKHLHNKYQIHPSFYSTHWFMTVFTYYFNFGLVSRIWDMFLYEGWKPVYRIALALMKIEEKNLLHLHSETDLLLALKVIQEAKSPSELLKAASHIKFKTATVNRLAAEFEYQQQQQQHKSKQK
jgi:TBC1 domain family member 10